MEVGVHKKCFYGLALTTALLLLLHCDCTVTAMQGPEPRGTFFIQAPSCGAATQPAESAIAR